MLDRLFPTPLYYLCPFRRVYNNDGAETDLFRRPVARDSGASTPHRLPDLSGHTQTALAALFTLQ